MARNNPLHYNGYCIHDGYTPRRNPEIWDSTEYSSEFQTPVYISARKLCEKLEYKSVIDVGCGTGYKLIKYFSDKFTIGVDVEKTIGYLRKAYPLRCWYYTPLNETLDLPLDIAICADVVEHMTNPNLLLSFLQRLTIKHLVISTPERELLAENSYNGPPRNPCHVREWSAEEFKKYISRWFKIEQHYIVDKATQVIEAVKYASH